MADAEFYALALPCKKLSRNKPHDKFVLLWSYKALCYGTIKNILGSR